MPIPQDILDKLTAVANVKDAIELATSDEATAKATFDAAAARLTTAQADLVPAEAAAKTAVDAFLNG